MDAEEELARARIGTAVGVWRLERLLGIGGMASVYAGRRSDGVLAAVKLLHPYWAEIGEVRDRFLVRSGVRWPWWHRSVAGCRRCSRQVERPRAAPTLQWSSLMDKRCLTR